VKFFTTDGSKARTGLPIAQRKLATGKQGSWALFYFSLSPSTILISSGVRL
jgi:hypothetical protein